MEEIIKVEVNENQEPIVSGRNLHEVLEIKTPYTQWFERMVEYGFGENVDFVTVSQKSETANNGYTTRFDHAVKLDMAKEICMLQRSEKGRLTRKYFIEVEKELNSPEKIMARALKIAENKLNEATNKIKYLEITNSSLTVDNARMLPKAEYFDELVDRNLLTSFRETAKLYGIKERVFINFLLDKKFVYRDKKGKLMPFADRNDGLFEIKETFNEKTAWRGTQTLITPKGRETFRLLRIC